MRIRRFLTLILPYSALGRGSHRHLPDDESYTKRRNQELFVRSKGTGDDRTPAPTKSPTVRPTYRPTLSPTATRTSGPTFRPTISPTVEDRVPGGSEAPGEPIFVPPKTKDPEEIETDSPTPSNNEITEAPVTEAPVTEAPATEVPSPGTGQPIESPTPAPIEPAPPTATPQQSPGVLCGDEILEALWESMGLAFTPDEAFIDPNSYQCRALQRVVEQEGYQNFGVTKTIQYWVLYCIYMATSSDAIQVERQVQTWENNNGWTETNLDPCDGWYGILCEDGLVKEIHLQRNGLSDVFPGEVSYLTSVGPRATGAGDLEHLDLFNNGFLTNNVDDSWIRELGPNLRVLNYGSTSFKGPIPPLPSGIVEFDCSYTLHSGEIPESVFVGLENLRLLIMDGNNFNSAVPSTITTLPKLEFFYIREAGLQGDLSYMEDMPSIVEHLVDRNPGLTGPVYSSMGGLDTLRSFSAADCGLVSLRLAMLVFCIWCISPLFPPMYPPAHQTGTLPTELGELTGMVQLWLYGNSLSGYIPSEFAQMDDLRILALEDTDITGNVPIEICLQRFTGALTAMSTDCDDKVDCSSFFPTCCTCCGRSSCGT
jgi:hypothetical protein